MILKASPDYASFSEKLGAIFDVCSRVKAYRGISLLNLRVWLVPAIELNQVVIFYDVTGAAIAYFAWAYLNEQESSRFVQESGGPLTYHQRLEGEQFWITDLVATTGAFPLVKQYIRNVLMRQVETVRYKKRRVHRFVCIKAEIER
ncbi:toxin-activating lysine-acyltransferase [Xanthomonas citri]|uniref:toxin-activating lysine-acyltransferase n=1 Tax=Xanthomonas citri TaxID=346 RepID=UPI0009B602E7|nr:toxin-activating lysine-acyltransferase [Xanthomonas citri]